MQRSLTAAVFLCAIVVGGACTHASSPTAPTAAAAPAPHDEAAIIARTTEFFGALDRADGAAVEAMLGPEFVMVIPSRFYPPELFLSWIKTRAERGWPRYSERSFEL